MQTAATTVHAPTGIDVTTYIVKDLSRARAFYADVIGLPQLPGGSDEHGYEFELADGSTFGIYKMPDGTWHKSGWVMFRVNDVPAAAEYFKSRGVTVHAVDDNPRCQMAICEDSEGNDFILHRLK